MTSPAAVPSTRRSAWALYTLLSVTFINILGFGIVVPLLPFYGQSFHAAPWQIGLIFSAYSMGSFFGEPFWGRLSDRIGRKPLLVSAVSGEGVTELLRVALVDIREARAVVAAESAPPEAWRP